MTQPGEGSSSLSRKDWIIVIVTGVIALLVALLVPVGLLEELSYGIRILIGVGVLIVFGAGIGAYVLFTKQQEKQEDFRKQQEDFRKQQEDFRAQVLENQKQMKEAIMRVPWFGYRVDENEGTLHKGNIRNVALRVESAHNLVNNIAASVPEDKQQEALYKAGKEMGKTFFRNFTLVVQEAGVETLEEKLKLWANYDATAGMGRFDFSRIHAREVALKNGFLSDYLADVVTDYVIAGYIAGVLEGLLGDPDLSVQPSEPLTHRHMNMTFKF